MASSVLRFRKLCFLEPAMKLSSSCSSTETMSDHNIGNFVVLEEKKSKKIKSKNVSSVGKREWRCIDSCCWAIGCICTAWWVLLFVCQCLPATLPVREAPGERLRREEGLTALHPVVLVPGIVTGGLELWEGKPCSDGLFRKRLWGGSFTEIFKR